ncbi:MAG: indolepyruvate oxidoreductase subunit beta [Thermodesulfobacteriota bacterium]
MSIHGRDPINLIITGIGGQGNILISRLIGEVMLEDGYWVTIGETYGASQRGGSVASHVRISKSTQHGPLTPEGQADIILGLEPVESLRMLGIYGNPKTYVITNIRPIHPMAVAIGEAEYPELEKIKQAISELSQKVWYIDASEIAIRLGSPLLANMVMMGALVGTGLLPLKKEACLQQLAASFKEESLTVNMKAFTMGFIQNSS